MSATERFFLLAAVLLQPFAAEAGNTLYKSVDEEGRVTYSSTPPEDAVEVEGLRVPPGPSAQTKEEARARVKAIEERSREQYQELKEGRKRAAQARVEAQERERREQEEAERQRRLEESLDRPSYGWSYSRPYWPVWGWGYPSPHPPIHLPRPPIHELPEQRPSWRSRGHINSPTRRW